MQLIALLLKRMYWFQDAALDSFAVNGLATVTRAQSMVISTIASGQQRASDIARHLGVSRQAIGQILADLEKKGFIDLTTDPADKRSRIATLKKGFAEEGAGYPRLFEALEQELARRIGTRRLANLRDALEAEWGEPPHIKVPDERDAATGNDSHG